MFDSKYRWRNRQLREHVEVLDGKRSPSKVLYNATYLHGILKQWLKGNIWIYQDRMVYVGEKYPDFIDSSCEEIDCNGFFLVPGYIEPHAHPFQLYNPLTFAQYSSKCGTTVLINDNLTFVLQQNKRKAFALIRELSRLPSTMYWWSRFDSQTELQNEESIFSNKEVKAWLEQDFVIQGGELTGWPKLLAGDDLILHWIQETKRMNKKIEGHFPGASEKTLAKFQLFGVDADHEAMNGEEVRRRLLQGYMTSLRYSSIRPDLPVILDELKELDIHQFSQYMLTTDGSSSSFYENGVIDQLIQIAIEKDIDPIEAYMMATYYPAKYFHLDHLHGLLATGRVADINFLTNVRNPRPDSVMAKGKWIKREGVYINEHPSIQWDQYGFSPMKFDWDLQMDDLQFSMPFGIKLENAVITKPYSIEIDFNKEKLDPNHDECFLMLVDRNGKWRVNTLIKGFFNNLGGFVSSFTGTGDILLIGKWKKDLLIAFQRMKEMGGGIVAVDNGEIIYELALPLNGLLSDLPLEKLIEKEKELRSLLFNRGYCYEDPIYTLLFFSATHLPYIRITPIGIFEVMKKKVLFPSVMR